MKWEIATHINDGKTFRIWHDLDSGDYLVALRDEDGKELRIMLPALFLEVLFSRIVFE